MDYKEDLKLREHNVMPTSEVLEEVLADSFITYEMFLETLPDLDIEQNWQWYTPHKAWYAKGQYFWTSLRGTRKEKNLYWLHVYNGYFCIVIWFNEKNRAEILKANVTNKTKRQIRIAKAEMGLPTFPVIFKVTNPEPLSDVYILIDCKKKIEGK